MSIIRKVKKVEQLFDRLEAEIGLFRASSQLRCLMGCGTCCDKPNIEASVLEFLPLAFHYFQENKSLPLLEAIEIDNYQGICKIFSKSSVNITGFTHGTCTEYKYRGLICRLFGYAASRDKYGTARLSTCKLIKNQQPAEFEQADQIVKAGGPIPTYNNYYSALSHIDRQLGTELHPVNKAIYRALEEVHNYYMYRPKPKNKKAA